MRYLAEVASSFASRVRVASFALAAFVMFAGCGSSDSSPAAPTPGPAASDAQAPDPTSAAVTGSDTSLAALDARSSDLAAVAPAVTADGDASPARTNLLRVFDEQLGSNDARDLLLFCPVAPSGNEQPALTLAGAAVIPDQPELGDSWVGGTGDVGRALWCEFDNPFDTFDSGFSITVAEDISDAVWNALLESDEDQSLSSGDVRVATTSSDDFVAVRTHVVVDDLAVVLHVSGIGVNASYVAGITTDVARQIVEAVATMSGVS